MENYGSTAHAAGPESFFGLFQKGKKKMVKVTLIILGLLVGGALMSDATATASSCGGQAQAQASCGYTACGGVARPLRPGQIRRAQRRAVRAHNKAVRRASCSVATCATMVMVTDPCCN